MTPQQWKQKLGPSVWNRIANAHSQTYASTFATQTAQLESMVAEVLTEATTLGFTFPEKAPVVNDRGTAMLWPGGAALTAHGIAEHMRLKGHGFFLLRVPQLMKAIAPTQILARFQEIMGAYEEQCAADQVEPLPVTDGHKTWRVFVGGEHDQVDEERQLQLLKEESPPPSGIGQIAKAAGPGAGCVS